MFSLLSLLIPLSLIPIISIASPIVSITNNTAVAASHHSSNTLISDSDFEYRIPSTSLNLKIWFKGIDEYIPLPAAELPTLFRDGKTVLHASMLTHGLTPTSPIYDRNFHYQMHPNQGSLQLWAIGMGTAEGRKFITYQTLQTVLEAFIDPAHPELGERFLYVGGVEILQEKDDPSSHPGWWHLGEMVISEYKRGDGESSEGSDSGGDGAGNGTAVAK